MALLDDILDDLPIDILDGLLNVITDGSLVDPPNDIPRGILDAILHDTLDDFQKTF